MEQNLQKPCLALLEGFQSPYEANQRVWIKGKGSPQRAHELLRQSKVYYQTVISSQMSQSVFRVSLDYNAREVPLQGPFDIREVFFMAGKFKGDGFIFSYDLKANG